ncbi:MAG: HypC/HybG/HupF family hydrogenase formation chaperone [Armatimonadota bacterium]
MCVAIPSRIVAIEGETATVEVTGTRSSARLDLLEDAQVGDYVLVHAGFAITRLDREEAEETLALMSEVGLI